MAVAPLSSARNFANIRFMFRPLAFDDLKADSHFEAATVPF